MDAILSTVLYTTLSTIIITAVVLTLPCWAFYMLVRRFYYRAEIATMMLYEMVLHKCVKYYIENYQPEILNKVSVRSYPTFDNGPVELN